LAVDGVEERGDLAQEAAGASNDGRSIGIKSFERKKEGGIGAYTGCMTYAARDDPRPVTGGNSPTGGRGGSDDTRARLLLTGERLFATRGIDGASTREITREAGVHADAIHYHFGTKDALVAEILERGIARLDGHVERLLGEVGVNQEPTMRNVADALVQSSLAMAAGEGSGRFYLPFAAAVLAHPRLRHLATSQPTPWSNRMLDVLTPLTPGLTGAERSYRVAVAGFLLIHALSDARDANPIAEWLGGQSPEAVRRSPTYLRNVLIGLLGAQPDGPDSMGLAGAIVVGTPPTMRSSPRPWTKRD
jgi:AcrR family transcriptional regulator